MSDNPFRIQRQPRDLRKQPAAIQAVDTKIQVNMSKIRHKIAVLSGKGGVGKSFVSSNIALAIASTGKRVGVVDVDFHGPSIPKMMGIRGKSLYADEQGIIPVDGPFGVKVVSMDFLLPKDDTPVVWRGAIKHTAIKQFLGDVKWGELDYLFVDMPPGTGDEALSIMQLLSNPTGFIIVTIPSEVSTLAVKKSISFAKTTNTKILGIIENMSYYECGNERHYIFGKEKGRKMAEEMGVPLLGEVPIDERIAESNDLGEPFFLRYPDSETAKAFLKIAESVLNIVEKGG
ncbi:ATP-binding protein [Sulfolobales archaeon HS-7]|nr:ATP-binding protein [Sulfolobales archaeon HS-7]